MTKWPTCSSNIDGFCNGGELPGMVRVKSMTYFQDHKWYDELADRKLKEETLMHKAKVKNHREMRLPGDENINYDTSNADNTQDNQGHKKYRDNPTHEPSVCKNRRFEMMKYSFNDDEECIAIKESEYLNHSKDNLDAYRELLCIINEGWVVATPDDEWMEKVELNDRLKQKCLPGDKPVVFNCLNHNFNCFIESVFPDTQYGLLNPCGYADAIRRPCCKEIDDMVYSEKDVS
ncbi:hypothetical protein Tco_0529941 [Tanacetum coccineum]